LVDAESIFAKLGRLDSLLLDDLRAFAKAAEEQARQ
jgi:hypothetical protein